MRSSTQPVPIVTRNTPRTVSSSFEPRVVHADSSRSFDPTCTSPTASSTSTRRPSIGSFRASNVQKSTPIPPTNPWVVPTTLFLKPSYLEHSAFRHLLQSDASSSSLPSRKEEVDSRIPYSGAMSPPSDSDDDSAFSPPPPSRDVPAASTASVISHDQVLKLPTRWSDQYHHQALSLSNDGRELEYQGVGGSERDGAAAARSTEPIPPACGIYYYEVEIRSKGPKAHISVGFAGPSVRTRCLPGWEPNSWGYHGDDGRSFAEEKTGSSYGPTFGLGDVIGCGIDFSTHRAFYTKNGNLLGPVFENVGRGIALFPSVGLQHPTESVRVNFGHEPFKFDIDYHVQQQRNQTWANLMLEPIHTGIFSQSKSSPASDETSTATSEADVKRELNKLVLSYLAHHGYVKTAMAFQKQSEAISTAAATAMTSTTAIGDQDIDMADAPAPAPSLLDHGFGADIELRTRVVNSVLERDIDLALSETREHYPAVLGEKGLMMFKLRCRKFVELILDAAELKKKMDMVDVTGHGGASGMDGEVDGMGMEVDDDARVHTISSPAVNGSDGATARRPSSTARYEAALNEAIAYGQTLQNEYKSDPRPEVKSIFKQTFSIVAYEDPSAVGGTVAEVVGHEARVQLANELNQEILRSQGRPTHPTLETMYRWTSACLLQLGLSGVGAAAFADMEKELLDA
ncbi:hypothetical protein VNI00_014396 [Paramarasmius palmivorus]|uniref:Ran-binding protein 10 n=1 Tax=Paramarasmius palmivorus TaxID=297713 RepID=A0AAW0BTF2_9AGAR